VALPFPDFEAVESEFFGLTELKFFVLKQP